MVHLVFSYLCLVRMVSISAGFLHAQPISIVVYLDTQSTGVQVFAQRGEASTQMVL